MSLFKNNIVKSTFIILFIVYFCAIASYSHPARKSKGLFKGLFGLHGRITSITRFYPFEFYDVSNDINRDLCFEYLEITTFSGKTRKMIYLGLSEFMLEDEACFLFTPTNYGSFLLKDIFEEDDPAKEILALSSIRIAADGIISKPTLSHCLLCSDEKEFMNVVYLGSGKGSCKRWKDEEGVSYVRIESDDEHYAEANSIDGCLNTGGSGGCIFIKYREY